MTNKNSYGVDRKLGVLTTASALTFVVLLMVVSWVLGADVEASGRSLVVIFVFVASAVLCVVGLGACASQLQDKIDSLRAQLTHKQREHDLMQLRLEESEAACTAAEDKLNELKNGWQKPFTY